ATPARTASVHPRGPVTGSPAAGPRRRSGGACGPGWGHVVGELGTGCGAVIGRSRAADGRPRPRRTASTRRIDDGGPETGEGRPQGGIATWEYHPCKTKMLWSIDDPGTRGSV